MPVDKGGILPSAVVDNSLVSVTPAGATYKRCKAFLGEKTFASDHFFYESH